MDHYWKNLTTAEFLLPSILDPRMKNLSFVSSTEQLETQDLLYEKFQEMKKKMEAEEIIQTSSLASNNSQSPSLANRRIKKKNKTLMILADLKKPSSPSFDEITEYLQYEEIDLECDPFIWWHERQEKFPILSCLAKKYLAVYACSTASERLFSDAGNMLNVKRTRIIPKLFQRIMFLKRNSKHLDSIHPPNVSVV